MQYDNKSSVSDNNIRKNALTEEEMGLDKASIVDRQPKKLIKKLNDEAYGLEISKIFDQANADRSMWLTRQEAFLQEYDEFLDPIDEAPADWSANLHLPIVLTILKTFHARFYQAVLGQDPICNVKARKEANTDRVQVVQDLMQYTLKEWANNNQGIEAEIDKFIWNWASRGVGILKMSWDKRYSRFVDVVKEPYDAIQYVTNPETGEEEQVLTKEFLEKEKEVVIEEFNGPLFQRIPPENLVIIGGKGDIDAADAVIEEAYLTESDLWTLADQKIFDADVVSEIINGRDEDTASRSVTSNIKVIQTEHSGEAAIDKTYDLKRYQILEAYVKKCVDGSGINSEIVCWVHKQSGMILRATYLHRVNRKTKKRPYAKADFYMREGQTYGIGLIELTYSICKEIDALNNMSLDFGLLSSIPFGYYKASSAMTATNMPIAPGELIPVDDPSSIVFPNIGARSNFSMQYLQFLYSIIEKLTGINDLQLGVIGGQGVTRTASGVQALQSESNSNLDIFLRRLNRALKKSFEYTFALVQDNLPKGLEFRIFGDDGQDYFRQIKDREEISGNWDFNLEANSSNSNPGIRLNNAQQMMQLTSNPLDLQLGLITPQHRYEALKNYLIALGVKDYNKFLQKPKGQVRVYTPEELANRILAGVDVKLDPMQDLQGFVDYVENYVMAYDEVLGQFNEQQAIALKAKSIEAQQMMQALQQMQAQQANASQMQQNAANSMQQTSQNAIPATVASSVSGQ